MESICLYVGGGSGTSESSPLSINLYDLSHHTAPSPSNYAPSTNLLGNGDGLSIEYIAQDSGLMELVFSGNNRVKLIAGHMYVFEIQGISGTEPMQWTRSITNSYAGGSAYRNRNWILGDSQRDFGFALYTTIHDDPPLPLECTIDAGLSHQEIDGFGAGVAYLNNAAPRVLPQEYMDFLYGTDPGQIGLSIIRVPIEPREPDAADYSNWSNAMQNARRAYVHGATILASPWSPPASMKSNGSVVHGFLPESEYGNYVDYLNTFIDYMADNNAPVSVISLQNEPDIDVSYEGCEWTSEELRIFCRYYAGNISAPVMMPESFHYNQSMSNPTLNDSAARANVAYIGGHLYGGGLADYPLAHQLGFHTWMTEYLINEQEIEYAIETAVQVSNCLTEANMSAYIWWKLISDANGLLSDAGVPQRRSYVMGQFSKFVRPGYVRIDSSENFSPNAVSAFVNKETGDFAIVAINHSEYTVPQKFLLKRMNAVSVIPWITTDTQSMEQQAAIDVVDGAFEFRMPAYSIATIVGNSPVVRPFMEYLERRSLSISEHAFDADIDGDSMPTGLEYLFGTDPLVPDYLPVLCESTATEEIVRFNVSIALSEGLLEIQSSYDLQEWTTEGFYDFTESTADSLGVSIMDNQIKITFSRASESIPARFYRIRFSLP